MRYFVFVLILITIPNNSWAQKTTIKQELLAIQKKYGVHFIYNSDIKIQQQLSIKSPQNKSLKESLNILFKNKNIKWTLIGNNIILEKYKIINASNVK